jgi:hypothetical protein
MARSNIWHIKTRKPGETEFKSVETQHQPREPQQGEVIEVAVSPASGRPDRIHDAAVTDGGLVGESVSRGSSPISSSPSILDFVNGR